MGKYEHPGVFYPDALIPSNIYRIQWLRKEQAYAAAGVQPAVGVSLQWASARPQPMPQRASSLQWASACSVQRHLAWQWASSLGVSLQRPEARRPAAEPPRPVPSPMPLEEDDLGLAVGLSLQHPEAPRPAAEPPQPVPSAEPSTDTPTATVPTVEPPLDAEDCKCQMQIQEWWSNFKRQMRMTNLKRQIGRTMRRCAKVGRKRLKPQPARARSSSYRIVW
jgi:hypothetical protein